MLIDASRSFSLRLARNLAEAPAFRFLFSSATLEAACTSTGIWTWCPCWLLMVIIWMVLWLEGCMGMRPRSVSMAMDGLYSCLGPEFDGGMYDPCWLEVSNWLEATDAGWL
jgi:hypothetical protein